MIKINDFTSEYHWLKPEIDQALNNFFESGWYVLGTAVSDFEKEFADYIGSKYCVGVANGLEALQISLMALGVKAGDEVITVSNSAVATSLAITQTGATVVFADIDEYYHMDIEQLRTLITPKTKAILPVHLFGQLANIEEILKIAKEHNIPVVEDACQAHGAEKAGKKAGSFGSLGCFSFYPTKNLGAFGDGGAITTDSEELYKMCWLLRNYGQETRYTHLVKGLNSRLDEMQAALLSVKLRKLAEMVDRRNAIAAQYLKELSEVKQITLPKVREGYKHAFHLFVIQVPDRAPLQEFLKTKGVESLVHYPIPIHKQPCYPEYNQVSLPVTEKAAEHVLSLPVHPFLKPEEVTAVCDAIKEFYSL